MGKSTKANGQKWRCATCKMANEADATACTRCKDEKKVLIEKPAARGNSHGVQPKLEPMRFSTCKKPTGAAA